MVGKEDDQDTSKGKVLLKETIVNSIETKPEAVQDTYRKVGGFVIAAKIDEVRTEEIYSNLEKYEH